MGKGEDFERQQCRRLSLWWTEGERDDVFWRNRLRRTSKSPDGRHQLGDIVAVDEEGAPFTNMFNVELKKGYALSRSGKRKRLVQWDLLDLIDSVKGLPANKTLFVFWEQCVRDAALSGRLPILIFKRDFRKSVVCIDERTYNLLSDYCGDIPCYPYAVLKVKFDAWELILVGWNLFFNEWLYPSTVRLLDSKRREGL